MLSSPSPCVLSRSIDCVLDNIYRKCLIMVLYFDTQEGRCLRTISDAHAHFVTTLALSSVAPVLISGSVDKNIGIWSCA